MTARWNTRSNSHRPGRNSAIRLCPGLVDRRIQGRQQGAVAGADQVSVSRHGGFDWRTRDTRYGRRSEIAKWELKFDDLGRVVQRTYLNQSGYPTSDANGIYVQEFTYTPAGKVKAIRYLDIGGQPCSTKRESPASSTNMMCKEIESRQHGSAVPEHGLLTRTTMLFASRNTMRTEICSKRCTPVPMVSRACIRTGVLDSRPRTTNGETGQASLTSGSTGNPA